MRIEKDSIGERSIGADKLFGIHSLRAKENFPDTTPFFPEWYCSLGSVKQACYLTYKKFQQAAVQKYPDCTNYIHFIDREKIECLIDASKELSRGKHFEHFIVPAISGGAGTSINMNINEIITNRALELSGRKHGEYDYLDPIEHANIYQSTNDVVPTSLKLAIMEQLDNLEIVINQLRREVEGLEVRHQATLRTGYTQMQEAVPTSFGKLFSSYSDALSRDWWRVSKAFERIKVINLGGSAVGTGITVPRYFIFEVVNTLQQLTQKPLTRAENLADQTSNLDSFVEIHAILKAHAVNLEKIASDIRLMASDLHGSGVVSIPAQQIGSSIMPGKINPVISEFVISIAHRVYANDMAVSSLAGQGCLELNAYLPMIGHSILDSFKLLIAADFSLLDKLVKGMVINTERAYQQVISNPSIATVLLPYIGYHKAAQYAKYIKDEKCDIFTANKNLNLLDNISLQEILKPDNLLKLGFTIGELKTFQTGHGE